MEIRRILIASDSFKGSVSAIRVAEALGSGLRQVVPHCRIMCLPMSDGGEGTGDAVEALGGERVASPTTTIYGNPQSGYWIRWNRVAVIEASVGSAYVPPEERTKASDHTTSVGTGMLVSEAMADPTIDHVYVALGGTGSTDGGMGFLAALGAEFFDDRGAKLLPFGDNLRRVRQWVPPHPLLKPVTGLYDVGTPLLGPYGAVHLFGPQKGIEIDHLAEMEEALAHYARRVEDKRVEWSRTAGAGAAGGIGFGILAAGGELLAGAQVIGDWCKLSDAIASADLVITGEGQIDSQTIHGKVVGHVVRLAGDHRKPVFAVVGSRSGDLSALHKLGLSMVFPLPTGPLKLDEVMGNSEDLLKIVGEEIGWLIYYTARG